MLTGGALAAGGDVTNWFSSGDGWIAAGVLVLIAALTGKGGQFISARLPVFGPTGIRVLAGVLALGLMGFGYAKTHFRVTKLAVDVIPTHYDDVCPTRLRASGTIRTAGGDGHVTYRFRYPHRVSPERTVYFPEPGGKAVGEKVQLTYERLRLTGVRGDVTLEVISPDTKKAKSISVDLRCRRPVRGFKRYKTDGYSAQYPRGWRVTEDDLVRTTYHRTRFESRDGTYFVLIDWSPGIPVVGRPHDLGEGYEQISYHRVDLGSRSAFEWRFRDDSEERVNYLFQHAGDGYAVLAGGYDMEAVMRVARQIAASITAR